MEKWIKMRVHDYLRHGGKTSRRNNVKRLILIAKNIAANEHGVKSPSQIGRAHIHRYYVRHQHLSARTLLDHYYAVCLLWALLKRPKKPPKPTNHGSKGDAD